MATTHDVQYDTTHPRQDARQSTWSWLILLAIIVLAVIAIAAYVANSNQAASTNSTLNGQNNSLLPSSSQTQSTGQTGMPSSASSQTQ